MTIADVWVVGVAELAGAGLLDRYRELLSADERDRLAGFHREADRLGYLAAHGLARLALSSRGSTGPRDWQFSVTEHGRPEVRQVDGEPALRFNLSHTRGTVACVVTERIDCGIDVENTAAPADVPLLTRGTLTAAERAALAAHHGDQRHEFFRYWTLKEAYAKARGLGMSMRFSDVGFDLTGPDIGVDPGAGGDPHKWRFEQWCPTATTVLAVALHQDGRAVEVVRHDTPPR